MELKILTQNLHCLVEENIQEKQERIAQKILELDIDFVFLQEVAQTSINQTVSANEINSDNYALALQQILQSKGKKYDLNYIAIKESFGIYDEGVGILSKHKLDFCDSKYISKIQEYSDWKSRMVLICKTKIEGLDIHLATTHFGWSDGYEVFEEQFDIAVENMMDKDFAILAGDYNITPDSIEYKHIINHHWYDTLANTTQFNSPTFRGDDLTKGERVRLDYVMTNKQTSLLESQILFDEDRVSDHLGVYVKIEV